MLVFTAKKGFTFFSPTVFFWIASSVNSCWKGSTLNSIQDICKAAAEDGEVKPLAKKMANFSKHRNVARSFRRWIRHYAPWLPLRMFLIIWAILNQTIIPAQAPQQTEISLPVYARKNVVKSKVFFCIKPSSYLKYFSKKPLLFKRLFCCNLNVLWFWLLSVSLHIFFFAWNLLIGGRTDESMRSSFWRMARTVECWKACL